MKTRKLGNSSLQVTPLCFGGNVFGWTIDEAASFRLLDALTDAGLNFIDTADVYSRWKPGNQGGESETIIGKWLKQSGKRDRLVIATKVGVDMGGGKKGLSKAHMLESVDNSLRRLQTDYIDLYQSHKDDPDTPQEETLTTYAQLIRSGKVRAIGASNFSADRLRQALEISEKHGLPRYESLQPEYNLYIRTFENELEPLCRESNIGVISYYSLASGFLSGKYRSEQDLSKSPRGNIKVKNYLNERGSRILDALDKVAAEKRSTRAQVAIAWVMSRPSITAPIASATSVEQLQDLLAATELKLDAGSMDVLNRASS
jgi:aryl-alcohol dehydrogenase-like predicted oxidoreductase